MTVIFKETELPKTNPPRRVRITDATGVWFATAGLAPSHLTGDKLGRWLTRRALARGVQALYEPATEKEYQAYKKEQRAAIADRAI